ncbi:MAG TPA: TetR family transcriptional regulator [Mycobacteriales bacterium]|nr:TetR family transcriptional regulator [Mycobacteriales bacterium]
MPNRRPLSRDRVLRAALTIADAKGVEAVSMRSVATRLGVEAMSLYNHVANKKALLDGLFDLVIRTANLPTGDATSEVWIRGAAKGLRGLAQEHPRLMPLLSTRAIPLADSETARPFEAGMRAFTAAGHDPVDAFVALQSVLLSLLAMTQVEATAALQGDAAEESALADLPAEEFPLLRAIAADPATLDDMWAGLVAGLVAGFARP